eukprot:3932229-Rhodomonas_salina.1
MITPSGTGRECICFCMCLPADVAWGVEHGPRWRVREVSGLLCRPGRGQGGMTGVEEEDREGRSESDCRSESDKQVQPVGPGWRQGLWLERRVTPKQPKDTPEK